MNGLGRHGNVLVAFAFFVLGIVWFATGNSGLGAVFVAVGAVFVAIDQQKDDSKD